jgi:hypothetical protein|tara:strand:- start:413 stop:658 length:246 start_codon:yes stop_codon:yes gene_type:complete
MCLCIEKIKDLFCYFNCYYCFNNEYKKLKMTDITENCDNSEVTYSFTSNSNTSSDNISEKSLSSTSEFSEINDESYLTEYF